MQWKNPVSLIAYSNYCGVTRTYHWQFNLHKTNTANEVPDNRLDYGREVQVGGSHSDCTFILSVKQ